MGKEDETTNSSARANNNNKTRQRERAKKNKRVENAKTDGGSGIIESPSSTGNEVYVPHTNQTMETLMKKEGTSNNMLPSSSPPVSLSSKPVSSSLTFNRIFLTPEDGQIFDQVVRDHYQGFVHVPKNVGGSNFHENNKAILERLRDANYYQYDVVMAGGKHSSRTFVKRTLVGDPGITYKYLGLRLFAHAWRGQGVLPIMKAVGEMNQAMVQMTRRHKNHGRCDYNLTLINYMEPTSHSKIGFKEEVDYGMGKVSVSWHADSSLELNSSIGVYHCLPTQKRNIKWDWRIGLRRAPDNNDGSARDVPPISVSTKDGDAYFLLGTFNETHQHCVLAGSEASRISSTHRVAVTKEDTYDYILRRVKGGSKRFRLELKKAPGAIDPRVVIHCQKILTQVEMEWIAQYWLQGAEHDKMHVWWQKPMKTLEAYWSALEDMTLQLFETCRTQSIEVKPDVTVGLVAELKNRQEQREKWDGRRADKIYQRRIAVEFRPVPRPVFGGKGLGKDLTIAIRELDEIVERIKGKQMTGSSPAEKREREPFSATLEGKNEVKEVQNGKIGKKKKRLKKK